MLQCVNYCWNVRYLLWIPFPFSVDNLVFRKCPSLSIEVSVMVKMHTDKKMMKSWLKWVSLECVTTNDMVNGDILDNMVNGDILDNMNGCNEACNFWKGTILDDLFQCWAFSDGCPIFLNLFNAYLKFGFKKIEKSYTALCVLSFSDIEQQFFTRTTKSSSYVDSAQQLHHALIISMKQPPVNNDPCWFCCTRAGVGFHINPKQTQSWY